jgi:anti-anti-sigma factor
MNIERKETDVETTFILTDQLVAQNIAFLAEELNRFVKNDSRDAIIDLAYVRKIDSMAIAGLIRFKNLLAENNRNMHIINPNETIFRVLELSGLDKFLLE